jgi:hypothetical protein
MDAIAGHSSSKLRAVAGPRLGYLPLAVVAVAATLLLWVFLTETKPAKYED